MGGVGGSGGGKWKQLYWNNNKKKKLVTVYFHFSPPEIYAIVFVNYTFIYYKPHNTFSAQMYNYLLKKFKHTNLVNIQIGKSCTFTYVVITSSGLWSFV